MQEHFCIARKSLAGFVAMGLFWGAWHTLIPDIKSASGLEDAAFGGALLWVAAGAVPAMLLGGRAVDRFGPGLLPVSIGLFALTAPLPVVAASDHVLPTYWTFSASLFVLGAASGLMDIVMNARVGSVEARTGRRHMQMAHGTFAAIYLASATSAGLARSWAVSPGMLMAGVAAAGFLLAFCAAGADGDTAERLEIPAGDVERGDEPRISSISPTPHIAMFGSIACVSFLAENGLQTWSALFLERELGGTASTGSLGPVAIGAAIVVGRFAAQAIGARIGDYVLVRSAAAVGASGAFLLALSPTVGIAVTGIFFAALGGSILAPAALSAAGRAVEPSRRGRVTALVGTVGYTGFFIGPALLGALSELFSLRVAFAAIGGVLMAVLPVWSATARQIPGSSIASNQRRHGGSSDRAATRGAGGPTTM